MKKYYIFTTVLFLIGLSWIAHGSRYGNMMIQSNKVNLGEGSMITALENVSFAISPNPTENSMNLFGWYVLTDSAAALSSASPVTISKSCYNSRCVMNVSSSVGLPYNLQIMGISIDNATETETPADIENILVESNGYFQTEKFWLDAVTISIMQPAKSCTMDVYKVSYWNDKNRDITVIGSAMTWIPNGNNWNVGLKFSAIQSDGSLVNIEDVSFTNTDSPPRAALDTPGRYQRTDYSFPLLGFDKKEGLFVTITYDAISSIMLSFQFSEGLM